MGGAFAGSAGFSGRRWQLDLWATGFRSRRDPGLAARLGSAPGGSGHDRVRELQGICGGSIGLGEP